MIQVQQLMKKYGNQTVVNQISFDVKENEIFGLLGPNGAGKTTTMEMMEGLRVPDGGTITIHGYDVKKQVDQIKKLIGIQLQSTSLFAYLTVREILELYRSFYPKTRTVEELLVAFRLEEKAKTLVKNLSGGQKQRLAIAIAVIHDPKVIFLDEPTTGLDPKARRDLWDLVLQLRSEGRTVLLSTHYMEEAEILCDRIAIMDRGQIIALDTPRKLIEQYTPESRIEFDWDESIDSLQGLVGVEKVISERGQVTILTKQMPLILSQLISWTNEQGIMLQDLRTRTSTLEDVFLALTGKRLTD